MSQAAKRRREEAEGGNPVPSTDHRYTAGSSSTMSLMAFKKNKKVNTKTGGFTVSAVMRNLRPSTADPERLFSFGRLSKNYLQTRLTPEHHDRNLQGVRFAIAILSQRDSAISCDAIIVRCM